MEYPAFKTFANEKSHLFFELLKENEHIKAVLKNENDIPEIRLKSILTSGAGLVVISRGAGAIFNNYHNHYEGNF